MNLVNFEIFKPFSYMTEKVRAKIFKYLENGFLTWKGLFIIFNLVSIFRNCLSLESGPINISRWIKSIFHHFLSVSLKQIKSIFLEGAPRPLLKKWSCCMFTTIGDSNSLESSAYPWINQHLWTLMSGLLTYFWCLFWCFHCWLWTSKCRLGSHLN